MKGEQFVYPEGENSSLLRAPVEAYGLSKAERWTLLGLLAFEYAQATEGLPSVDLDELAQKVVNHRVPATT